MKVSLIKAGEEFVLSFLWTRMRVRRETLTRLMECLVRALTAKGDGIVQAEFTNEGDTAEFTAKEKWS